MYTVIRREESRVQVDSCTSETGWAELCRVSSDECADNNFSRNCGFRINHFVVHSATAEVGTTLKDCVRTDKHKKRVDTTGCRNARLQTSITRVYTTASLQTDFQ